MTGGGLRYLWSVVPSGGMISSGQGIQGQGIWRDKVSRGGEGRISREWSIWGYIPQEQVYTPRYHTPRYTLPPPEPQNWAVHILQKCFPFKICFQYLCCIIQVGCPGEQDIPGMGYLGYIPYPRYTSRYTLSLPNHLSRQYESYWNASFQNQFPMTLLQYHLGTLGVY